MCEMAKAREGASRGERHSKKWRENKRAIKMLGERRTETGSLLSCDLRLAGPVISPSLWDNGLGWSSCFPELSSISQPTKSQRPQCAVWLLHVGVCECKTLSEHPCASDFIKRGWINNLSKSGNGAPERASARLWGVGVAAPLGYRSFLPPSLEEQ